MSSTPESFDAFFVRPDFVLRDVQEVFPQAPPIILVGDASPIPVVVPAAGAHEPLVQVVDRTVGWAAAWWRNGWLNAVPNFYLRAGAAKRLSRAAASLPHPWSLVVIDAWRSRRLQEDIYRQWHRRSSHVDEPEATPGLFAPHVTGGAVDVTLAHDGVPLLLGSPYMRFDEPESVGAAETVDWLRRVLHWCMVDAGFCGHPAWWWQYEFGTSRWAAVTNCDPLYGTIGVVDSL
jgi:zinc D-Ala-D-Ala dipeptidase